MSEPVQAVEAGLWACSPQNTSNTRLITFSPGLLPYNTLVQFLYAFE